MMQRQRGLAYRALFALLLLSLAVPAAAQRARNVILFIGDGMGPAQVEMARQYSREVRNQPLRMLEMAGAGRMGVCFTRSSDALVTDSAAAGTALATGSKTKNGMIAQDPEGKRLPTILELAKERGLKTGLVATSTISHATPASFAAHVPSRGTEAEIAARMLALGPDVLLGGGVDFCRPRAAGGKREDDVDLVERARQAGYAVALTREDLSTCKAGRVLGLFSPAHMAPALGRERSAPTQPGLVEMTRKALDLLAGEKGFFLMVEGSQIDHRCHSNDGPGALAEVLEFDEAVGLAYEFARRRDDTLVMVTADHETGGLAFTGGVSHLQALSRATVPLSGNAFTDGMDAGQVCRLAAEKLGVEVTEAEVRTVLGDAPLQRKTHGIPLARLLGGKYGLAWGTTGHSAMPVYFIGYGPGSEGIRGVQENTAVFDIMRRAFGF